jgi:3-oxoacyl-(acyl-carrier-protein) synthase
MISDRCATLPLDTAPVDLARAVGCIGVGQHAAIDPAIDLAERAAREALFMAGLHEARHPRLDAFIGASKGAASAVSAAARMHLPPTPDPLGWRFGPPPLDAARAVALGPHGYLADHLRRRLGLRDATCTVAACASSLTALHQARRFLQQEQEDGASGRDVLVIASEAALLPLFIHSYARLGVLPPLNVEQYRGSPLDKTRGGFVPAELAAAVVLRRLQPGEAPPAGAMELVDTAVATEGFDVIRTDPAMPALERVARRLLGHGPPDLIHPHATGTVEHDPAEMAVYRRARAGSPDIYACKGALGHGLGAAGLVSLVLACLCAKTNRRPPMPWLTLPMDSSFALRADAPPSPALRRHAIFAAGFGGHVAGALVQKI